MTDDRARNYTSTASARSLHETFVRNVLARLGELGQLHTLVQEVGARVGAHMAPNTVGRPKYDWLSAHTGIPRRTLENLLNLHNQPTMVGAAAIAKALGVPLDRLLGQEDFGRAPTSNTSATIACIHTTKLPNMMVCAPCLAKWQSYQQRLRALYETNRTGQREGWDAENTTTRAAQLAAANLPKDTDER